MKKKKLGEITEKPNCKTNKREIRNFSKHLKSVSWFISLFSNFFGCNNAVFHDFEIGSIGKFDNLSEYPLEIIATKSKDFA